MPHILSQTFTSYYMMQDRNIATLQRIRGTVTSR